MSNRLNLSRGWYVVHAKKRKPVRGPLTVEEATQWVNDRVREGDVRWFPMALTAMQKRGWYGRTVAEYERLRRDVDSNYFAWRGEVRDAVAQPPLRLDGGSV